MVRPGVINYYFLDLSMSLLLMFSVIVFIDLKCDGMEFKNILISPFPLIIFICVFLLMKNELLSFVLTKKNENLLKLILQRYLLPSNLLRLLSVITIIGVTVRLIVTEQLPSIWILVL